MPNEVRDDLKYTTSHEWIRIKGKQATVGITDHAQSELTDIVFVELPTVGKTVNKGDELCVVESVKSVSEVYAPVGGTVTAVNTKLDDTPELINKSPYHDGWIVELEIKNPTDLTSLLDPAAYKKLA